MHIQGLNTEPLRKSPGLGINCLNFGKQNKGKISHDSESHQSISIIDYTLGPDRQTSPKYYPFKEPVLRGLKLLLSLLIILW
jgi:hypothetical protein